MYNMSYSDQSSEKILSIFRDIEPEMSGMWHYL